MKQLPKYYAIKRDYRNPLWRKYIDWVNANLGLEYFDHTNIIQFLGFDGSRTLNRYFYDDTVALCVNPVTIITLSDWAEATGNDVLEEGDWFRGTKEQIGKILNIEDHEHRINPNTCQTLSYTKNTPSQMGCLVSGVYQVNKLTFEDFLRRAKNTFKPETMEKETCNHCSGANIRTDCMICHAPLCCKYCCEKEFKDQINMKTPHVGNNPPEHEFSLDEGFTNPTTQENGGVQFDPSREFEVSDDGINFHQDNFDFVGFHGTKPVVFHCDDFAYMSYKFIRNIQPFTASMLEVGEYMETNDGNVYLRLQHVDYMFTDINTGKLLYSDFAHETKGRRVNVEHRVMKV